MIDILLILLGLVAFVAGWIWRGVFNDDYIAVTGWQIRRRQRRNRAVFRRSRSR